MRSAVVSAENVLVDPDLKKKICNYNVFICLLCSLSVSVWMLQVILCFTTTLQGFATKC